jgi:hypothetical protein
MVLEIHTSCEGLSSSRWNRVCLHVARIAGADVIVFLVFVDFVI